MYEKNGRYEGDGSVFVDFVCWILSNFAQE